MLNRMQVLLGKTAVQMASFCSIFQDNDYIPLAPGYRIAGLGSAWAHVITAVVLYYKIVAAEVDRVHYGHDAEFRYNASVCILYRLQ